MLHINKFKFGLNEDVVEVTQNDQKYCLNYLTKLSPNKISKKDVKILATIGPKSCSKDSIKKILNYTKLFRINGSHNTLDWHVKISKKIKEICPESFILLDIPGLKPRTNNDKVINVKKDQIVNFSYGNVKIDNDYHCLFLVLEL